MSEKDFETTVEQLMQEMENDPAYENASPELMKLEATMAAIIQLIDGVENQFTLTEDQKKWIMPESNTIH